jgi:hypothetical protein
LVAESYLAIKKYIFAVEYPPAVSIVSLRLLPCNSFCCSPFGVRNTAMTIKARIGHTDNAKFPSLSWRLISFLFHSCYQWSPYIVHTYMLVCYYMLSQNDGSFCSYHSLGATFYFFPHAVLCFIEYRSVFVLP